MKSGSDVAMSSIKPRKLPLRTVYKYQSIPWKQSCFQLYTKLLRLYTYKYSPALFQFECYSFLQGLLHFHSFCFFHLEAKYKWLLNDLKQHNKSYILETCFFLFLWKLISEEYNRGWLRITVLLRHKMGSKHFLIICVFK